MKIRMALALLLLIFAACIGGQAVTDGNPLPPCPPSGCPKPACNPQIPESCPNGPPQG